MRVRITHSIGSSLWSFVGGEEMELAALEEKIGPAMAKVWLSAQSGLATPVREAPETLEDAGPAIEQAAAKRAKGKGTR